MTATPIKTTFRGEEIELKPQMGILCDFQRETGKNPWGMDWRKDAGPIEFCLLFSFALKRANITVTIEDIEANMTAEHIEVLGDLIKGLLGDDQDPEKKTMN